MENCVSRTTMATRCNLNSPKKMFIIRYDSKVLLNWRTYLVSVKDIKIFIRTNSCVFNVSLTQHKLQDLNMFPYIPIYLYAYVNSETRNQYFQHHDLFKLWTMFQRRRYQERNRINYIYQITKYRLNKQWGKTI